MRTMTAIRVEYYDTLPIKISSNATVRSTGSTYYYYLRTVRTAAVHTSTYMILATHPVPMNHRRDGNAHRAASRDGRPIASHA